MGTAFSSPQWYNGKKEITLSKRCRLEQLIKVSRGGQVTIPSALRRKAGIEVGDYLEVRLEDDRLVLTPKHVIDKSQSYFWTEAWQQAEREAEADLKADRVERFETLEELFADLDAED